MIAGLAVTLVLLGQAPVASGAGDQPASPRLNDVEASRAEYQAKRHHAGRTSFAQLTLARWCLERGLVEEAEIHASTAVKLNPQNESAWRLLGYVKVGERWVSPNQARDEAEQRAASLEWGPKLTALHQTLHGPPRQNEDPAQRAAEIAAARATLAQIKSPGIVAAVYREFARGGPEDQEIAVQIFEQIPTARASQAIAALAIHGSTQVIRLGAIEALRPRDPAGYVDALLELLKPQLQYRFVPNSGEGPGTVGQLIVEDEHRIHVQSYNGLNPNAPVIPPDLSIQAGDWTSYDAGGALTIHHRDGGHLSTRELDERFTRQLQNITAILRERLTRDVANVESQNESRRKFNAAVLQVLKGATGADLTDDKQAWSDWLADKKGYPRQVPVAERKRVVRDSNTPFKINLNGEHNPLGALTPAYEGYTWSCNKPPRRGPPSVRGQDSRSSPP